MKKGMRKTVEKVLKFFIAIILLYLLLRKVDWSEVKIYFKSIKLSFVFLFIFFYLIGVLVSAGKWQFLANMLGFRSKYFFYFKNYLLGIFLNNFFPSFVGGDAYRIYVLGGKAKSIKKSSISVIVDRVTGLISVIILAFFFSLFNYKVLYNQKIIFWLALFLLAVIVLFLLLKMFFSKTVDLLLDKIKVYFKKIFIFSDIKSFLSVFGYSFLFIFFGIALANYMLFLSLDSSISFFDFLSVVFLTNIIASVPISIGNIGVKEWAYVFLFGFFGVPATMAITIVFISRILQMLVSLVAIPFYFKNSLEKN